MEEQGTGTLNDREPDDVFATEYEETYAGGRMDPLDGGLRDELFATEGLVLPPEGWGFLKMQEGDPGAFVDPGNEELGRVGRNGLTLAEVVAWVRTIAGVPAWVEVTRANAGASRGSR